MRLLAALDLHDRPESVLDRVIPWARRLGATLDLGFASRFTLEGLPRAPQAGDESDLLFGEWERKAHAERADLDAILARIPEAHRGRAVFLSGPPSEVLASAAVGYDLVAIAHHQRVGLPRLVAGSVTARIVRTSPAPVLVVGLGDPVPDPEEALYVLAPVDLHEPGALPWLSEHLPLHRTEMVHVRQDDGPVWLPGPSPSPIDVRNRAALEASILGHARAAGFPGIPLHLLEPGGHAGDRIAALGKDLGVDVIVMPTHQRSGLSRLALGSVAERVCDRAHCAVLVVPWTEASAG